MVGKVTDDGGVAEFSVDGTKVELDEAGSFNVNTYIPEGGITLMLEAIDLVVQFSFIRWTVLF